jgi:hypothetical protein
MNAAVALSSRPAVIIACKIISLERDTDAGTVNEKSTWCVSAYGTAERDERIAPSCFHSSSWTTTMT